jgi:predicted TPR repeat methyltransferase
MAAPRQPIEELFARSVAHHRAGRLERAAQGYDELLRRAPKVAGAWSMRGVIDLQRGRPSEALPRLRRAIELDPAEPGAHLNLGNALRGVGRLDEAIAAYERALGLAPDMVQALNNLGNARRDRGELAEACVVYRRALALEPTFFAAAANLAQVLARRPDVPLDEALAAHDGALALAEAARASGGEVQGRDAANLHNGRGNLLAAAGRTGDAIESYRSALAHDGAFAEAHLNLGRTLARELRVEEAIEPLRRALALRPEDVTIHPQLALALRRLRRDGEAAEVYRAWHALAPDDPIAAHLSRARGAEAPPARASDAYLKREFDGFAAQFDDVLVGKLDYRGPALVAAALERAGLLVDAHSRGGELDVLDAGCGTGLAAQHLRPLARRLVGVDLSGRMLEQARPRGYDELVEAELCAFARARPASFDLVVATEVLLYFGTLEPVLEALGEALRPGGQLVFTVEHLDDGSLVAPGAGGWALGAGGRYAHHPEYVRRAVSAAGLVARELVEGTLRLELGEPVRGWVVTAERPG